MQKPWWQEDGTGLMCHLNWNILELHLLLQGGCWAFYLLITVIFSPLFLLSLSISCTHTHRDATSRQQETIFYSYTGAITYLEHVVVNLTIRSEGTHDQRGDISLELISPMGTQSTLLNYRSNDDRSGGYFKWPFMSVMFWGENPRGWWRLTLRSRNRRTAVSFEGLRFQFYGTSVTPESVSRIPDQCHSDCARGCAAEGSMFCDACVNLRNAYTLECIESCPPGYTERNGYCYDRTQPEPVCDSKLLTVVTGKQVYTCFSMCGSTEMLITKVGQVVFFTRIVYC